MKAAAMIAVMALLAAGCAEGPVADPATTTIPGPSTTQSTGSSNSSSLPPTQASSLPMCDDTGYPTAPEDWYADTPLYVGNEMPVEEVQAFASTLDGYENIWIDREHRGWVTVGFVDADVVSYQAALEGEFPGVGVVAVEMPMTRAQLDAIRQRIDGELSDGMNAWNIYDARGVVEVWVGLLNPDRIATVEEVVGDDPACLTGQDPATTPLPGPQPEGGDGWAYLGEVDFQMLEEVHPVVIATPENLADVWLELGMEDEVPAIDFQTQIVIGLTILHSSSCPETRLDDVVMEGDMVQAVIVRITEEMACTDDGVPRTYLMSLDRDLLPPAPFRVSGQPGSAIEATVESDLREPGSVATEGEVRPTSVEERRIATSPPVIIETGFPWTFTFDPSCGVEYLGVINWVGWHAADGPVDIPTAWEEATVNGLLDLELLMTEGPAPTLTATVGGVDVLYLPGSEEGLACD